MRIRSKRFDRIQDTLGVVGLFWWLFPAMRQESSWQPECHIQTEASQRSVTNLRTSHAKSVVGLGLPFDVAEW